jgi:hypothetical protein
MRSVIRFPFACFFSCCARRRQLMARAVRAMKRGRRGRTRFAICKEMGDVERRKKDTQHSHFSSCVGVQHSLLPVTDVSCVSRDTRGDDAGRRPRPLRPPPTPKRFTQNASIPRPPLPPPTTLSSLLTYFRKAPDPKDLVRKWQADLRSEQRGLERQIRDLQREEKLAQKNVRWGRERGGEGEREGGRERASATACEERGR